MRTERLLGRIRKALVAVRRVEEKTMFGGVAFLVNEKLCVSVGHGRMMCRVDPELHDSLLQRRGTRTVTMKNRKYRGYIYVDEEVLHSGAELRFWLERSLDFNRRAKSSRPKKKRS